MEGFVLVELGGLHGAHGTLLAGGDGVPRVVGRVVRWYYRSVAVFDRVVGGNSDGDSNSRKVEAHTKPKSVHMSLGFLHIV